MRKTLLLDSSYYPIEMIDWKKALSLFFTERAEVVDYHENISISSTNKKYQLPKVMRLFCKVGKISEVKFNRMNIFYRDSFTCQYCNIRFNSKDLTLDHVHPKSKGGETSWTNIVTACEKCNCKKKAYFPKECGMYPLSKPREPKWMAMFLLKLSNKEKKLWKNWFFN